MNITQVKIFPVEEEKLKAFVSIVFDHCFMVNDIKVIQGKDGLFLSMPSRRKKSGEFKDVAHPLNNETRRLIEETVLGEYRCVVSDPTPRRPDRLEDEEEVAQSVPTGGAAGHRGNASLGTRPAPETGVTPAISPTAKPPRDGSSGERSADDGSAEDRPGGGHPAEDRSLEEVQEEHLRDSFWTVS